MLQAEVQNINGGNYTANVDTVNNTTNITHIAPSSKPNPIPDAFVAFEAMHDAKQRYPQPRCHEGTRVAVLQIINDWVKSTDPSTPPLFWLYGTAGVGKSALMQTICNTFLKPQGSVRAAFFFGLGQGKRGGASFFIPTLIYQLSTNVSRCYKHCRKGLKKDPALLNKTLEGQASWLASLLPQRFLLSKTPVTIVVDGLDECADERIQAHLVELMAKMAKEAKRTLRFLIASRPEMHILNAFNNPDTLKVTKRIALDETFEPAKDIYLYLSDAFSKIARESHLGDESPWPEEGVIDLLVQASDGQFMFPHLVIRFVSEPRQSPQQQLLIVLDQARNCRAFSPLDLLYTHILARIPQQDTLMTVLSWILSISEPEHPHAIAEALGYDEADVKVVLQQLRSVLKANPEDLFSQPVVFAHASFRDFLSNEDRSVEYSLSNVDRRHRLHVRSLEVIQDTIARRDCPNFALRLLRQIVSDGPQQFNSSAASTQGVCNLLAQTTQGFTSFYGTSPSPSLSATHRIPYLYLLWFLHLHNDSHTNGGQFREAQQRMVCPCYSLAEGLIEIGSALPPRASEDKIAAPSRQEIRTQKAPISHPVVFVPTSRTNRSELTALLLLFIHPTGYSYGDALAWVGFDTSRSRSTVFVSPSEDPEGQPQTSPSAASPNVRLVTRNSINFSCLDIQYARLLTRITHQRSLKTILSWVLASSEIHTAQGIALSLGYKKGDVDGVLRQLRSVIEVGLGDDSIIHFHASFQDFISNEDRSAQYSLSGADQQYQLHVRSIGAVQNTLSGQEWANPFPLLYHLVSNGSQQTFNSTTSQNGICHRLAKVISQFSLLYTSSSSSSSQSLLSNHRVPYLYLLWYLLRHSDAHGINSRPQGVQQGSTTCPCQALTKAFIEIGRFVPSQESEDQNVSLRGLHTCVKELPISIPVVFVPTASKYDRKELAVVLYLFAHPGAVDKYGDGLADIGFDTLYHRSTLLVSMSAKSAGFRFKFTPRPLQSPGLRLEDTFRTLCRKNDKFKNHLNVSWSLRQDNMVSRYSTGVVRCAAVSPDALHYSCAAEITCVDLGPQPSKRAVFRPAKSSLHAIEGHILAMHLFLDAATGDFTEYAGTTLGVRVFFVEEQSNHALASRKIWYKNEWTRISKSHRREGLPEFGSIHSLLGLLGKNSLVVCVFFVEDPSKREASEIIHTELFHIHFGNLNDDDPPDDDILNGWPFARLGR